MSTIRLESDRGVRLGHANRSPDEAAHARLQRHSAARFVLSWSYDHDDNVTVATELLDALGLDPAEASTTHETRTA